MGAKAKDGKPGSGRPRGSKNRISRVRKPRCYKIYCLYSLSSPNEYRYTGKTKLALYVRIEDHIYRANKLNQSSPRDQWIREVYSNGLPGKQIGIKLIEELPVETTLKEALQRENYYIDLFKSQGHKLTNIAYNTFGPRIECKDKKIKQDDLNEILKLNNEGISCIMISNITKIHLGVVKYWLSKYKVSKKYKLIEELDTIYNYIKAGYNKKYIVEVLGISSKSWDYRVRKIKSIYGKSWKTKKVQTN